MNHFPDCKIHTCAQRSDEWFDLRKGLLTMSEIGPWLLKKDKTSMKARENAICKLVAQMADGWEPENYENAAMKRGTELEPYAVASFEKATGKKIKEVGFCESIHGSFGCSPDGLIEGESAGLEGKAPQSSTHVKYRRAGILPVEYEYQVHGSMAVTGATSWWFQSYDPKLAPLRVLVERNQLTEDIFAALKGFSLERDIAIKEESKAWRAEFEGVGV